MDFPAILNLIKQEYGLSKIANCKICNPVSKILFPMFLCPKSYFLNPKSKILILNEAILLEYCTVCGSSRQQLSGVPRIWPSSWSQMHVTRHKFESFCHRHLALPCVRDLSFSLALPMAHTELSLRVECCLCVFVHMCLLCMWSDHRGFCVRIGDSCLSSLINICWYFIWYSLPPSLTAAYWLGSG